MPSNDEAEGCFQRFMRKKRTVRFLAFVALSLAYWALSAPSYDKAGFSYLVSSSAPALLIVLRVATVIVLLASISIVKGTHVRCAH